MALLAEYAITPDVFDITSYSSEEVCGLHLQTLKDVLLDEGLVRDLRAGDWAHVFAGERAWHRRGKELLKKLATQQRLIERPAALGSAPASDPEWCNEALASHKHVAVNGIVVTAAIAGGFAKEPLVSAVDRLSGAPWWQARSASIRLGRTLAEYRAALGTVLRHSNSLMFIDPHIDPERPGYADFAVLLDVISARKPAPLVEIHRVCYEGSGPGRVFPTQREFEESFQRALAKALNTLGLSVEVFIWDDFHDRYLVSNLLGITLPNGFDTTKAPNAMTTWTRLGRPARDDVQREFDRASTRHILRHRFRVP
jgi:hypothetical protein